MCSTKGNSKFVSNDFIKDMKPSITIIGRISGLSVGLHLHREDFCEIIEASDRAGGRIKTDSVDGFRLDRGFKFY
jgi:protoporphyrinogen oxidase